MRFRGEGPEIRLGRLEDDSVIDAGRAPAHGFVPTPENWASIRAAAGQRHELSKIQLLAPIVPGKLICIGLNYRKHAAETGNAPPKEPVVFAKFLTALNDPESPIVLPYDEPEPDFEAEMALVIGMQTRRATRENALAAVGGITAVNDVSGRQAQRSSGGQFLRGKSFDTFAPLGPCIADAATLDPDRLGVRCVVSGETMQDSTTADMIFDCAALIEYCSAAFTLEPGDVIATGTPEGVGMGRDPKRWLRAGDIVEVTIEGVGTLRNPVVAENHG